MNKKEELKDKLDRIRNIWNNFILEYKYCQKKIKFTPEVQTNYFGDILGYFHDTFDIIYSKREGETNADRFSNQISLLQSIYVQQDFIEEILSIFKIEINKGDLKKDSNYIINRDIRNELIGHPIRKHEGKFISSCVFGYNGGNTKIVYLRYHKDNNYEFESMEFEICDIISRHSDFLNTYFDLILKTLNRILNDYRKQIENLERLIDNKNFTEILNIISVFHESIFEFDFIYDKESLLEVYSKKDEHRRYQNLIDKFYIDLKETLREKKEYSIELFEPTKIFVESEVEIQTFNIQLIDSTKKNDNESVNYHYELGKLATKRNPQDFYFFGGNLRSMCINNPLVIDELKHMESNIYNKVEYYCAYWLICVELNENN